MERVFRLRSNQVLPNSKLKFPVAQGHERKGNKVFKSLLRAMISVSLKRMSANTEL